VALCFASLSASHDRFVIHLLLEAVVLSFGEVDSRRLNPWLTLLVNASSKGGLEMRADTRRKIESALAIVRRNLRQLVEGEGGILELEYYIQADGGSDSRQGMLEFPLGGVDKVLATLRQALEQLVEKGHGALKLEYYILSHRSGDSRRDTLRIDLSQ